MTSSLTPAWTSRMTSASAGEVFTSGGGLVGGTVWITLCSTCESEVLFVSTTVGVSGAGADASLGGSDWAALMRTTARNAATQTGATDFVRLKMLVFINRSWFPASFH